MIKPSQLLWANAILGLTLAGASYGRMTEHRPPSEQDFLRDTTRSFRGWKAEERSLSANEVEMLQPDASLIRWYTDRKTGAVELAVIAGHKKRTVHTPGFCMAGGGWETFSQGPHMFDLGGRKIPAIRSVLVRNGQRCVMSYFFTDGEVSTESLPKYQWEQFMRRLRGQATLGALVRIRVPFGDDQAGAEALSDEFARAVLPQVLDKIKAVRTSS